MIIGINAGHTLSGEGFGAVGYFKESTETRNLTYRVAQRLEKMGHKIIICNCDSANSQDAYLENVVYKANKQPLDLFLSIHFNAYNTYASGVEVYTYKGKIQYEGLRMLEFISALGFKNRGLKDGTDLKVVRKTKARAVLLEVCFCDNKQDAELYKKNVDKIADAICRAIAGEETGKVDNCSNTHFEEARKKLMEIGVTDGTRPQETCTREQVWSMLYRLMNHLKK